MSKKKRTAKPHSDKSDTKTTNNQQTTSSQNPTDDSQKPQPSSGQPTFSTPFGKYYRAINEVDRGKRYSKEYGSIMILSLVEEVGEMARAYLAEHGRKTANVAAQLDETYEQELGDLLLTILRLARIKKIDLDKRLMYSINKIKQRRLQPKT